MFNSRSKGAAAQRAQLHAVLFLFASFLAFIFAILIAPPSNAYAIELHEGQQVEIMGTLQHRAWQTDWGEDSKTNQVYYVVALPEEVTCVSSDGSIRDQVSEIQIGQVLSGYGTSQPLIPTSDMVDPALEPSINRQITAKGKLINYSGAFFYTTWQLEDAELVSTGLEKEDMYRLYNPNSGEHFYTANTAEKNDLVKAGWNYEGIGWTAPVSSKIPVYRLYNANGGEHHYTTDVAERDMLVDAGWSDEGIGWYSDDFHKVPIYRDYNPNAFANNHNYTADWNEHLVLMDAGWRDEGVGWFGM